MVADGGQSIMVGRYEYANNNHATSPARPNTKVEPLEVDFPEDEETLESALLPRRENTSSAQVKVYFQRWVQLGYLSGLALLSDWICFSVAASSDKFEEIYELQDATQLIDWFLFTNVITCFLVTDCVAKMGLQRCVQGAALLMALGTWCRVVAFWARNYPLFVLGTLLVGAAQPFFQCTPPLLSAVWFASDERATSTAVALNFNQIGIAVAFLVGGHMGSSQEGLSGYFLLMALLGSALAVGTLLQFQSQPPTPPSLSELEKQHDSGRVAFVMSAHKFLHTPGFLRALSAFICSISITNIVGALMEDVMHRGGVTQVALAGGGFEVAIVVGGIVLGGYVDRTKRYKSVTCWCLVISILLLIPLGVIGRLAGPQPTLVIVSLLLLGFFTGPIQPINAELAVDVTFPGDETAVESVQQIGGNLVSALLMPCAEWAARQELPLIKSDIRGDIILLMAVSVATLIYFSRFHAPLKRTMADVQSHANSNSNLMVNLNY